MKKFKVVRDIAIIIGCYVVIALCGWLLGTKVASPAIARLILGETDE